jgi:hypothetical protein
MGRGYIPGRIGGDNKVLDRWADYSSENSYHPTKAEKAGGAPKEQNSNKGRFTARDTNCNCGPRAEYPGAKDDLND